MRFARPILLLTPPMTQLNTPYPATAYLTGYLKKKNYEVVQADPAIELVCRLFSKSGLERIKKSLLSRKEAKTDSVRFFLEAYEDYSLTVDSVIKFLQGKDPSLATRIAARQLVPEGPRFQVLNETQDSVDWAFGAISVQDRAKYFASLYLDDLCDVVSQGIDPYFSLSRYGEKLAASVPSFDPLEKNLLATPTLVSEILAEITKELIERVRPAVIGLTVPFPGNVLGALQIAKTVKEVSPQTKIVLGGGYVNTELRELSDPGIFSYVDFITLDDGERPFECILEFLEEKREKSALFRTFVLDKSKKVEWVTNSQEHDIPFKDSGTPTYEGLPLDRYLSVLELLNPMHRLWSDARWNKMTLAHGCYWKKCSFCDVTLDYIGRYDSAPTDILIERMSSMIRETGQTGFHFVDEAAPPAGIKALSQKILEKQMVVSWWGNIRFDKTFTPELAELMASSGCIAVSGGLEVASDRLLKLMQKGVTVEQVARVTANLRKAGIMVHAYLMYGFPTQTTQETVDSLERVRQLFAADCIQSAYWHRFSATIHSPIGKNPEAYGIQILKQPIEQQLTGVDSSFIKVTFAKNDLPFIDLETDCDHDSLGIGLRKAVYNFMHGVGLEEDVRFWFRGLKVKVPQTTVPRDLILKSL